MKKHLLILANPNAATQQAAQQAWRNAWGFYGQTEAFRFYGGPIDDDNGPEGCLNAWPMDELFVDKVVGNDNVGLINDRSFAITTLGIENVWLGRYKRTDGSLLQGPSPRDLVAVKDVALASRTGAQIVNSVAKANAIQAPFDREIIGAKDAPGRQRIKATVNSLVQQSEDLVVAVNAVGITKLTLVQPS